MNEETSNPASLRQGFTLINKVNDIKANKNKSHASRNAKINFYQQDTNVMSNTTNILNKDEDIKSQLTELKSLEAQYAELEKNYKKIRKEIMTTTQSYVNDPSSVGKNVYVSTILNELSSTYQGIYVAASPTGDSQAMTSVEGGSGYTFNACQDTALQKQNQFFALQNVAPDNTGQCVISNDLTDATKYGEKNSSCTQGTDGFIYAGSWTNAVYKVPDAEYVGTFQDSPNRAMELINGGSQTYSYDSCKKAAADGGYSFFALQDGSMGGNAQCAVSNDYSKATGQGINNNFFTATDGHIYGGPWANSLYEIQKTTGNYIGCYKDNENRAMDQVDNLSNYSVETCQQKAISRNAKYFAVQSGTVGTSQCFVSNNLSAVQQYGEAEPYFTGTDGNTYGMEGANAIYKLNSMGDPSVVGNAGYIDDAGKLSEYPKSMVDSRIPFLISIKNDNSCPKNITNIDSIQWNTYKNTGNKMTPSSTCGLAQAIRQDNQQLTNITNQMTDIASQIVQSTHALQSYNSELFNQMGIDKNSLNINLKKYSSVNDEVNKYKKSYMPNVNGLLSDTNVTVAQESQTYMFWSILAIATIILTMSMVHK